MLSGFCRVSHGIMVKYTAAIFFSHGVSHPTSLLEGFGFTICIICCYHIFPFHSSKSFLLFIFVCGQNIAFSFCSSTMATLSSIVPVLYSLPSSAVAWKLSGIFMTAVLTILWLVSSSSPSPTQSTPCTPSSGFALTTTQLLFPWLSLSAVSSVTGDTTCKSPFTMLSQEPHVASGCLTRTWKYARGR